MKSILSFCKLGAASWLALCGLQANAQFLFHVSVDTSSLVGHGAGPFALDFQLIDGGANSAVNSASVSNVRITGGAVSGSPTHVGSSSGDLDTTVNLSDTVPFNEFFQGIMIGSQLGFDVSLTRNNESGAPDAFSFAILDKDLANIPTTGTGDALLYVNISSTLASGELVGYSGTGSFSGVTVKSVPDSGEGTVACAAGLAVFAGLWKHRRRNV